MLLRKISLFIVLLAATSTQANWWRPWSPREEILTPEQQKIKQAEARIWLKQLKKAIEETPRASLPYDQRCVLHDIRAWFNTRSDDTFSKMYSPMGAALDCQYLPDVFVEMLIAALDKDEQGKVVVGKPDALVYGLVLENWFKSSRDNISARKQSKYANCKLLAEFLDKQISLHEGDYQKRVAELKEESQKFYQQK